MKKVYEEECDQPFDFDFKVLDVTEQSDLNFVEEEVKRLILLMNEAGLAKLKIHEQISEIMNE